MQDTDAVSGVCARYNMVNLHVYMHILGHTPCACQISRSRAPCQVHTCNSQRGSRHIHTQNDTVSIVHALRVNNMPYSRKYWRELNLVVEPKITIARILADLNLAVRYGIAIHIYVGM